MRAGQDRLDRRDHIRRVLEDPVRLVGPPHRPFGQARRNGAGTAQALRIEQERFAAFERLFRLLAFLDLFVQARRGRHVPQRQDGGRRDGEQAHRAARERPVRIQLVVRQHETGERQGDAAPRGRDRRRRLPVEATSSTTTT